MLHVVFYDGLPSYNINPRFQSQKWVTPLSEKLKAPTLYLLEQSESQIFDIIHFPRLDFYNQVHIKLECCLHFPFSSLIFTKILNTFVNLYQNTKHIYKTMAPVFYHKQWFCVHHIMINRSWHWQQKLVWYLGNKNRGG